jgi:methyltransferase family protein
VVLFWEPVIRPLLEAVSPRVIVEVGALEAGTTVKLLDFAASRADCVVHSIDPAPSEAFDLEGLEKRYGDRLVFHPTLSLEALPRIDGADAVLIDGDHNWYTVYNELRGLESTARSAGRLAPVFVLHDVSWPYGRRDGYYAPKQIPRRYRRPNAQLGLERGNTGLRKVGGANRHVWNAKLEGGRRNGVLTAVEDFLADHPSEFRPVVLDLSVGLAIIAPIDRLAGRPELADLVDRIDSDAGRIQLREQADEVVRQAIASGHFG